MRQRWLDFCRRAGAGGRRQEAFAELDRRYRGRSRYYHGWRHVAACLRELRRLGRPLPDGEEAALELALWFHDAVYEPGRADNEERSAELALHWSSALDLPAALGRRAAALILATRHGPLEPSSADPLEALLRDIDLAVLGGGLLRYCGYERAIAREYAAVPPESYREGRARLLRGLLARPAIYATEGFRRRLEDRARGNLRRALGRLEGASRGPRRGGPAGPAARPGRR